MKISQNNRITSLALAAVITVVFLIINQGFDFPSSHRNILLINVDTLRADHLGAYGYQRPTSPNIDELAAKSAVFERAYSHSPWTMPSVASIFTSLTPRDHGITNWRQPLPFKLLTLAEHLRRGGFHTDAYVSHVIFHPRYNYNQGFTNYNFSALRKGNPHKVSTAREISDMFIETLDRGLTEPFFVWLHYFDPHAEYLRRDGHDFGEEDLDRYDSEIRFTDDQIGRVLDELTERDMWDETVVVFIADHGEEFRDHGGQFHTNTLYDELIHIPMMISVPQGRPQRIDTIVAESDLAPTLCELVDLPVPAQFTGRSIPFTGGRFEPVEDRVIIAETLRRADKRAIRQGEWKYIQDRAASKAQLFNMDRDPGEHRNLASRHPEIARALQKTLDAYYGDSRADAEERGLSDELRQQLEALGYLGDS